MIKIKEVLGYFYWVDWGIFMWSRPGSKLYKPFLFFFFVSVIQIFYCISSYSNINPQVKVEDLLEKKLPKLNHDPKIGHSLAETLKEGLTGLSFESVEVQKSMKQNAPWFAQQFTQQISHPSFSRLGMRRQECQDSKRKIFCQVLKDLDHPDQEKRNPRSLFAFLKSIHNRYEINSWIKQGNVERLSSTAELEVRAALRKETSYSSLQKLISQTIASPSCKSAALSHLLGTKIEEFLPDLTVQKSVMKLYGKASSCGDSESSNRARYRLSLFHISKDQCESALPHLEFLTAHSTNSDYRSRALFWKIHCQGLHEASQEASQQARKILLEKYPFNFHTLLVQKESAFQKLPVTLKSDSDILFRAANKPALNNQIKVIEALLSIKELGIAKAILDRIQTEVNRAEPQFRLYVGVLYSRSNYHIKNFQLLSKVFRENPELISKAALEVYFPRNPVQVSALGDHEIDSKLLLSLIRQESAFNSRAQSSAGARGLMQLMPATARRFESIKRYDRLFDPAFNLKIGSKYFSELLERFGGDAELALAAYNAGPHRVDQWLVRYPVKNRILFLDLIPFKETREYVASIARNYFWYANLYPNVLSGQPELKTENRIAHRGLGEVFRFLGTPGQYEEIAIP